MPRSRAPRSPARAPAAGAPFPAAPASAALALAAAAALAACLPDPVAGLLPSADLSPPPLLSAGPGGPRSFDLRFGEEVRAVPGSYAIEPGSAPPSAEARGPELRLALAFDQEPGRDYSVVGEVEDAAGNVTRFVLRFCGWNDRPPGLRVSELQTGKNSSKTNPHRDYIELEALTAGNLGGVELAWASSVKDFSYRFRGAELAAGDFVVLHLAPEGLAGEADETGSDLAASTGADARSGARDFWSAAGGLPDAAGAVALRPRPGDPPADGLFYAEEARSGLLEEGKLRSMVAELADRGLWPLRGESPSWEDAFRWKQSPARSICRGAEGGHGPEAWFLSASGAQSPGAPNPPPVVESARTPKANKKAKK